MFSLSVVLLDHHVSVGALGSAAPRGDYRRSWIGSVDSRASGGRIKGKKRQKRASEVARRKELSSKLVCFSTTKGGNLKLYDLQSIARPNIYGPRCDIRC